MSDYKEYEDTGREENTNYKAIACEQIPELFLDKIVAKKHFGKFGNIKRFILRPKRLSCTIEYETKEDAENAFMNSGNFNGIDFVVNYAEHEVAHVQNTEEWVDPDVQAELEAMSPGHRLSTDLRQPISLNAQATQKPNALTRVSKASNPLFATHKAVKLNTIGRQNSPQPDIAKIDSALRNELEAILRTPAFTDEEKYRVLDARDKLIRLSTVRQTDIKKAVATKGTCPDMCPEKERLMREFQRQVSIFEMSEEEISQTTISHKKAVKEYSRSSADQEVPLSHELRSESVLQMTMLYLVHRIMGLCDDPQTSLGDWFHFVWDRTRSIRKDITQQELCSLGAVQLVEQCARFHIHCAARLISEDPSVFDKKINAENLTKCLQTLKYMYHDLRIKGVFCPCEAEFRSYVILLNLGDSNFLWEVKQLPELIQKSAEIKRAIEFYNALQNNNFVRFFSMIQSEKTSYLSACILLGYFTKLRVRAMNAIIKSHNWRKNDVFLPLSYLTRVLGFDNESTAASFFNHYGLQCDELDNRVLLDRLSTPDIEYAMPRALQLVESKRTVSVGECIFGQALPHSSIFENHQPHNSFYDNGLLKSMSWGAEDQLKENLQNKKDQELPEKRTTDNDKNLFKVPQTLLFISPKQQKIQNTQQEEKFVREPQENFGSISTKKEEKFDPPSIFKLGNNIFGGTKTVTASNESNFKFVTSNQKSEEKTNTFLSTTFEPKLEKHPKSMGNIFDNIATSIKTKHENIFGTVARETANIFQQQHTVNTETPNIFQQQPNQIPKETFKTDNVFKFFQNNSDNPFHNQNVSNKEFNLKIAENNEIRNTNTKSITLEQELKDKLQKIQEEKDLMELEIKHIKEQQKQKEEMQRKIEKERSDRLRIILREKSEQETEQIIEQFVENEVLEIAQNEILILNAVNHASSLQTDKLISEVIDSYVEDIANEEYADMCYDQLLLNRYFNRWLLHLRKKKEQKKLMENTPLWVTTDTRAQFVEALEHPSQQENLEMVKRYRLGQPCNFNKILNMGQYILSEKNQNPLNLFALVGQHLLAKRNFTSCGLLQQRKYFKFLITLPENREELLGFESFSNRWLMKFIENCGIETTPFLIGMEHNLALCVRKFNGIHPKNEEGEEVKTEGDHNDGIICFITGVDIERHSRKRLYNLLRLTKNLKRVPLAIIAYNCTCSEGELKRALGLHRLQEEGLIYSYLVLGCHINRKDFSFRKLFIKAVDFITKESHSLNYNEINALVMQNILPFLENSLGEEMWKRWQDSSLRNPIFNKICSLPKHVIGIYHKALDHLLHITQEDFQEMPEFPEELREFVPTNTFSNIPLGLEFFPNNWKDKSNTIIIKKFLKSLYLPTIEEKIPDNVEDLKLWLINYTTKCIGDDDMASTRASYEAITNLVSQVKHQYLQNIEFSASVGMINYLTVMNPIVFAHINTKLKYFHKELANINVIYLKDNFTNYQTQPWWLNYEHLNLVTVDYSENPTGLSQSPQQKQKENNIAATQNIDDIIAKAETASRKAEESLSELKRKKLIKNKISATPISSNLKLIRSLDDSLYQFELSKKVGEYDNSFATNLTHEIDKSIDDVLNQSCASAQKRKITNQKSPNRRCSDIDSVIADATNLIRKIDTTMEVKKLKMAKW